MSDTESSDLFSERSPWALLKRYGELAAVLSYRDQMEQRFPREIALAEAKQQKGEAIEYTWLAMVAPQADMGGLHLVLSLLGHFSVSVSHQVVTLRTYHALPRGGFRILWLRWFASKALHALCIFVGIMSAIALIILVAGLVLSFQSLAMVPDDPLSVPFCGVLAVWVLSILGLIFEKMIALPPFGRSIGRYPFALSSVKKILLVAT